ncbi:UNKNOWN [Stylonychia lemnae]|uniref:Uncharacterized protein n=1 Tax=Stylonychia lemnae TaxID=5949 RepID=A0A077ZR83_STYLE|nr:UNKNOWN [Stylonychia lemnae]|eukprot:CDW71850.1 UNKNOWN [Stylonychia lemnae]
MEERKSTMNVISKGELSQLDSQIDLVLLKKIVKQQMGEVETQLIEKINKEFDQKLNNVAGNIKLLTNKMAPINDLIALGNKHYGMSMQDAINEYVQERLLQPKFEEIRSEMLTKQELRDQLTNTVATPQYIDKMKEDLTKIIDMMNVRVTEIDNSRKILYNDLGFIKGVLQEKCESKDLRMIEKKLGDFAPWESVRSVYKELSFYLKKDDFELNKSEVQGHLRKIEKQQDLLISKQEAMREIAALRGQVYQDLDKYSKMKECQQDRTENSKQFNKIKDEHSDFRKHFSKQELEINVLKKTLENKVNEEVVVHLREELDQFVLEDDFNKLENKVIPKILEFQSKINDYTEQAETHNEIIRRYDEILSEKASRWALTELRNEIIGNYAKTSQTNEYQKAIDGLRIIIDSNQKDNEDHFDSLNKSLTQEIISAVRKAQKHAQATSGPLGNGMEMSEIRHLINLKANASEMHQLLEMKSNKIDTEQFRSLAKWVLRFDPVMANCMMGQTDGEEIEYMLQEENKVLQDFTDQVIREQVLSQRQLPQQLKLLSQRRSREQNNQSINQSIVIPSFTDQKQPRVFRNRRVSNQPVAASVSINRSMAGTQYTELTERTNESLSKQYNGHYMESEKIGTKNSKLLDHKKLSNKFPQRLDKIFVANKGKMTAPTSPLTVNDRYKVQHRNNAGLQTQSPENILMEQNYPNSAQKSFLDNSARKENIKDLKLTIQIDQT